MVCPKCGFSGASETECTECGIIFSKFFAYQEREKELARKKVEQAAQGDEDILDQYYGRPVKPEQSANLHISVWRGYLQKYFWEPYNTPWSPVPTWQMTALSAFFVILLYSLAKEPYYRLYSATINVDSFLVRIITNVNYVFHEAGHAIFRIFGNRTLLVFGGTLTQVLIPLIISMIFWNRRKTAGFAFAMVWMFTNFLKISVYMADARRPVLLELSGLETFGGHDWINLFNWWDLWSYDRFIAKTTWTLGWFGMVCTALWYFWIWFINRSRNHEQNLM